MKNTTLQAFKSRIGRRLVVAVVLFSSFITLISTVIQLYVDYKRDLAQIEEYFSQIEASHLQSIIYSVWVHDDPQIKTHLQGLLRMPDMEYMQITTDGGTEWEVGEAKSQHIIEKIFPLTHFYRDNNLEIGRLRAIVSLDAVYGRLFDKVFATLVSNGIKTFLVSGFVLIFFNMLVTRHLYKLAQHISSHDINERMLPLEWDHSKNKQRQDDELDQVATAYNIMQEKINNSVATLQKSELYNRTLFECSPIGLVLCRMNGELVDVNPVFAKIIGRSVAETKRLTYWDITPKKYLQEEESQLESLRTTKKYGPYKKEYIHKKGHLVPVRLSGLLIEQNGEFYIWSSVEDITEQQLAEKHLQMLVSRHQAIIGTTQDGFWVVDLKGRIIEVNDAYCQMSGYSRAELLTMEVSDLEANESYEDVAEHIKNIIKNGSGQFASYHRKKNGNLLCLELSVSYSSLDEDAYLCAFLRDISERHKLEAQLRQSQKMEAVGTLSGGIAHDFNNILAIILGNIELAGLGVGNTLERLQNIHKATLRGKELVNRLLTFSRRNQTKKMVFDPKPLVKEVLKFIRSTIPSSIVVREKMMSATVMVKVDSSQLHQMLVNLCTNAAQAMGERGGELEVSMGLVAVGDSEMNSLNIAAGDYLEIAVQDNGPGIAPEIKERIFEPFFSTKNRDEGTGLGLSVVHGVIQECNGAIKVDSEVGRGTTFRVYIPAVDSIADKELELATPKEVVKGSGRILFIDDEEELVSVGVQMLQELGYEVLPFTDPKKALSRFREVPDQFDIVITDQVMPLMTGNDLASAILALRPDLPIILCTGFSETVTGNNSQEIGFRKFLQKPVSIYDFSNVLSEIVSRQSIEVNDQGQLSPNLEPAPASIRVLLIDDDKYLTVIYEKAFKSFSNVDVVIALDGQGALDKFIACPDSFALLVVDYNLPDMSGIELIKAAKKIRPGQFVLLWSGQCDTALLEKAKLAGVQHCVEKPFGYKDGVEIISNVLPATALKLNSAVACTSRTPSTAESRLKTVAGDNPQIKSLRIIYVDDEDDLVQTIQLRLKAAGYAGSLCTSDPQAALDSFGEAPEAYDVVISDVNMPGMNGHELAERMLQIRPDMAIFLCSASVEDAGDAGADDDMKVVQKPSSFMELEAILKKVVGRFKM